MDWSSLAQFDWQAAIDYLAVAIGAVTGALHASARKLDIVGVVTIGLVTAYGGGIGRDLLLQTQGFFFMEHPASIVVCTLLGVVVFLSYKRMGKVGGALFYADALSMSWFAVAGAAKAWGAGVGVVLAVVLGTLTAVGGGVLRDVCTGEVPATFQPGNFYAVSAIFGTSAYVACELLGAPELASSAACILVACALTMLSRRFDWHTKTRD